MANIKICDELQIGKESANIDARYGPWLSEGEAVTTLSKWGTIAKGLTVGIIKNKKVVEYWFQEGTDSNSLKLVLKNNGGGDSGSIEGAELQSNKVTSIRTGINEPEDSPTAPSNDKYPSERAVALLYDNLETDVTEVNRKIGDLSHFQDNLDYNPDSDNLNIGDILKGLETKIIEFNWALEGTDADKDSNVFNNTPYSGYSVWKVLGELYNAVQKKKYNVRFTVTNGSKDPDNNYTNVPEGDTIEWVVTPYVNYKMPSRIDGAVIEDLNNGTYKVTVSDIQEDTEITCECTPIELPVTTHNVTISVNNGTVNRESQKVFHVEHNSGISCVLEANEYYHIPTSLPYSHMSISDTGILSITDVTADIEITIDCIKNKYTVTLNISNGTTTSDNPQLVDAFGSAVFNLAADQYYELPAKTSNNIAIVNGVLTVNNITSDQTINVVCNPKDCFVVFNLDGGTGDTPGALHVDANTPIPLPVYNGTKDGYTLIDSDNASWWIITDDTGTYEARMGGDYIIVSNTTIKPKWFTDQALNITVTKDGDGSSGILKFIIESNRTGTVDLTTTGGFIYADSNYTSSVNVEANVPKTIYLLGRYSSTAPGITYSLGTTSLGLASVYLTSQTNIKNVRISLYDPVSENAATGVRLSSSYFSTMSEGLPVEVIITNSTSSTKTVMIRGSYTNLSQTGPSTSYVLTVSLTFEGSTVTKTIEGTVAGRTRAEKDYLIPTWGDDPYIIVTVPSATPLRYLLTNVVPTTAPNTNEYKTASSSTMRLGELEGWDNWKDKDNQYIVFPVQSGKTNVSDYFTLTDMFGGNLTEDFNIVSTSVPGLGNEIIVLQWEGFAPLSEGDGSTATITFN